MPTHHIEVYTLFEGQTLIVTDQSVWETPILELSENVRIIAPMRAELTFFPQEEGFLIRGSMTGEVALSCNRCAEEARISLDVEITSFEPFPLQEPKYDDEEVLEADPDLDMTVFATIEDTLYFNVAAFLWEEFALALPVKPLCADTCNGLCAICGVNLNTKPCDCVNDEGDPRFAALRGIVIEKNDARH